MDQIQIFLRTISEFFFRFLFQGIRILRLGRREKFVVGEASHDRHIQQFSRFHIVPVGIGLVYAVRDGSPERAEGIVFITYEFCGKRPGFFQCFHAEESKKAFSLLQ